MAASGAASSEHVLWERVAYESRASTTQASLELP